MNLEEFDKSSNKNLLEEFKKLKDFISIEMNDFDTIESAKLKIDYIASKLISNNPDEIKILTYLDELSNIVGIQAYITDYRYIIEKRFFN
ncbi:MAG: hypothetical protein NTY74_04685 [Ignavibacteriae bacterium]|nr:hypothetical protein [Ignavibacteriota bacterium]